jgi:transposase
MQLSPEQFEQIKESLPVERGNVSVNQLQLLNAILYVAENGCKWRRLPKEFGNWHTLYTRMMRWSKSGVLQKIFADLQQKRIIAVRIEALSLDSTIVKIHPDASGALKKTARKPSENVGADGAPKFIWLPQMIGRQ